MSVNEYSGFNSVNGMNGIPILGGEGGRVKAPVQGFAAIAREIDENGMVDCETSQRASNGQVVGIAGRGAYMDANELLDAIEEVVRRVMREEMARAAMFTEAAKSATRAKQRLAKSDG